MRRMLVLIESLLFGRYKEYKFPRSFIERARDMNTLMNYHWGREAVPSHLDKAKYILQGYPFAFHLWLLESVPMLQTAFSTVINSILSSAFLCEKYLYTTSPSINQVLTIEGSPDVIFKLLAILGDAEDTICMEDEDDPDLEELSEVLTRGYSLSLGDWVNKKLDLVDALESIGLNSVMVHNAETFEASSSAFNMRAEIPSSSHSMIMAKLDNFILMVKEGNLKIFDRLHKIEEKLGIDWEDEVTESEGGYQRTPVHMGSSATIVADDVDSTEEDDSTEDENMDDTQVEDSQQTQEIPEGAKHELLSIEMIESHASEGEKKQALTQAENSQPTIPEGTPTQEIPNIQMDDAEGDPIQSEKELADSNSEKRDTELIQSLTTTEPNSDKDSGGDTQPFAPAVLNQSSPCTTYPVSDENIAQKSGEGTQSLAPVLTQSSPSATEQNRDETLTQKSGEGTQPFAPALLSQSPPCTTDPVSDENIAQKSGEGTQPLAPVLTQSSPSATEQKGDETLTQKSGEGTQPFAHAVLSQSSPVQQMQLVTKILLRSGEGTQPLAPVLTQSSPSATEQKRDETLTQKNVKGTHSMAIVLWQPSPSRARNQTDEVASEKRGLSLQKVTASVVAMDTRANEESAGELQKHVKVVDMLRIRPTVANRKAKEKRVDDEGDRLAKRLTTLLRRSNRDPNKIRVQTVPSERRQTQL
ncbi:unnamed protein product [Thlaspi arvense]|uniref:Uncharacterized protein n=1 Tax=Thlaspi arvense TaxID=13288 RepID=A0AAU9SQN6_THLAR|nr:unnamed protein product [Thlaspi arvense]